MKGVILAAGIASRLRPLTDSMPKCLLSIGGETILGRTLNNLSASGIEDVVIVTGYLSTQIRRFVTKKFPELHVMFIQNDVYATTNNMYSLWLAKEEIIREDMILLDSDIIFDKKILDVLLASGHDDCLSVDTKVQLGEEQIKVTVDGYRRILAIGKEVPPTQAFGESIGIEKFSPETLEPLFSVIERKILVENSVNEFYESAFQEVIDRGTPIYAVDTGMFKAIEIDTFEDIRTAETAVFPYLSPTPSTRIRKK